MGVSKGDTRNSDDASYGGYYGDARPHFKHQ